MAADMAWDPAKGSELAWGVNFSLDSINRAFTHWGA
jgi:hypothetical protein